MTRQEERGDAVAGDRFDGREAAIDGGAVGAEDSVSELSAEFGISRKTAYKWWTRYRQYGPAVGVS